MDLVARVALRYALKVADAIGDPTTIIRKFEEVLTRFASLEPLIPEMKDAWAVIQQADPNNPNFAPASRFYSSNKFDFFYKVKNGYVQFYNVAFELWLAFLQQYELTPVLRKRVEAASKFYSRRSVQKPAFGKEVEVYEKYLATYRDQLELAKTILAQAKTRGQGGTDAGSPAKKAGPFTIVNTGGFPDETIEEAAKVVETAAELLHRKGLSKVCYGEILLANTLSKANVLAFYLVGNDEMFVRANLKGKQHDAVRTVVHELAHRLHFKFLKSKDRDIRSIYFKLGMKEKDRQRAIINNPALRPQPGEKLVSKGKTYEVANVVYDTVHLHQEGDPKAKATVPLVAWLEMKGVDTSTHGASTFVTTYAKKNHEENFAEMVAFWCLNKLPEDQAVMLEEVLKG
jgi:hypothetical protein